MTTPVQPPDANDDFALMERAAAGETAAFATLIRRHQSALVNFFRRLGANHEAEDVAQETFLRVWRYRARYRPAAKFTTFLFTLGRHAWADHLRRAQKQERVVTCIGAEAAPHDAVAQDTARQRLDAQVALAALPEKLRLVVVMSLAMARLKDVFDVEK